MSDDRRIEVGTAADGEPVSLPVVEVLTGRGLVLGKSGSGKSNSVSVVLEELLEEGFPVLIVDAEGEYYGLKEEYELLHAGADEECDIQVGTEHAEKIASLALDENVPVILDVSGYLDESEASALVRETARHLFVKEKKLKKPFLLVVEEVHEYIPEGGGMNETGRMLVKVGKRGRKHGLGIVGVSQRPADVKKDFITQANWLVWHRLTWENDTQVVKRVVGDEFAEAAPDLDDGEAFVERDWTDAGVTRVQFNRKRTFDAGATPGLDDFERPELKSVSDALMDDLQELSEHRRRERDRIEELEAEVEAREARIEELEDELETARNVSHAARQLAGALSGEAGKPFGYEQRLQAKNDRIRELEATVKTLRDGGDSGNGAGGNEPRAGTEAATETVAGDPSTEATSAPAEPSHVDEEAMPPTTDREPDVDAYLERLRRKGERLATRDGDGDGDVDVDVDVDGDGIAPDTDPSELVNLLHAGSVVARIDGAQRDSRCNHEHTWSVVAALVAGGPLSLTELERRVDASTEAIGSLLGELRSRTLVTRDGERRYELAGDELRRLADDPDARSARSELARQWQL